MYRANRAPHLEPDTMLSGTVRFSYPSHSAYRPVARSTEPEVFTFDQLPEQHVSSRRRQQRRRVTRVMYPAKVRKYLPPAEKNPAKRWLLALCLVLLAQIYTTERDDEHDIPEAAALSAALAAQVPGGAAAASSPLLLHFRSAEDTARRAAMCSTDSGPGMNTSCEADEAAGLHEHRQQRLQQSNNPYVVALLYPAVYHTLGCEQ